MARTAPYGQHLRKTGRDFPSHSAIHLQADVNWCAEFFLAFWAARDIRPKLSKSRQQTGAPQHIHIVSANSSRPISIRRISEVPAPI